MGAFSALTLKQLVAKRVVAVVGQRADGGAGIFGKLEDSKGSSGKDGLGTKGRGKGKENRLREDGHDLHDDDLGGDLGGDHGIVGADDHENTGPTDTGPGTTAGVTPAMLRKHKRRIRFLFSSVAIGVFTVTVTLERDCVLDQFDIDLPALATLERALQPTLTPTKALPISFSVSALRHLLEDVTMKQLLVGGVPSL